MKITKRIIVSLVLCALTCMSLFVTASAAQTASMVLSLNKTSAYADNLPSTITMTVAMNETKNVVSYGAKAYASDSRITIASFGDGNAEQMAKNTSTGKFSAMISDGKDVKTWATVTFNIPNDLPEGTYTLGIKDIEAYDTQSNPVVSETQKTITFTVKAPRVLSSIAVTKAPTKTSYYAGETFAKAGMTVTAYFDDSTSEAVSSYTVTDGSNLALGKNSVTISYTYKGVTKSTTQSITVTKAPPKLSKIEVTTAPNKLLYYVGENFKPSGMVVKATYSDDSTKNISGYIITDGDYLTEGKPSVTISYTESGITKTTTQEIFVVSIPDELVAVYVSSAPTKYVYFAGENFDKTGMTLLARYSDGTEKTITNFDIVDGQKLTAGKTSITASYTENGITKTATQTIYVQDSKPAVSEIKMTDGPKKTTYAVGESFDRAGIIIVGKLADGSSVEAGDITVTGGENLQLGTTSVTVNANVGGVTVSIPVSITVKASTAGEKVITGLRIAQMPTKTEYVAGESFDKSGMIVMATYSDGTEERVKDVAVTNGKPLVEDQKIVTVSYVVGDATYTASVEITVNAGESHAFIWWIVVVIVIALGCTGVVIFANKRRKV